MKTHIRLLAVAALGLLIAGTGAAICEAETTNKKVVLVAGRPSHGPGDHEFNAGTMILQRCLNQVPGVEATMHRNGWPESDSAFDGAATIVLYMDGGSGHPAIQGDHLQKLGALMDKGVGLVCIHYAVEVPKDKGGPEFLKWIGGYYETGYSINPHWDAELKFDPAHPITNGIGEAGLDASRKGAISSWKLRDEWYFNMRFPENASAVKPILRATPPDAVRKTEAAKAHPGREETLAWAIERPDGGGGFGFTGAHFHKNWGDDDFRKLILNAILWSAKMDVPKGGVASTVTPEELQQNLDPKGEK